MAQRDGSGQRKVRLMSAWVGAGIAVLAVGLFTSPWITLLGACIIGSTPVWFTLRMALAAPRRPPMQRHHVYGEDLRRLIERVPPGSPSRERREDEHKR